MANETLNTGEELMMRDKEEYIEKYCIKLPIYILQNSYI
jgi:hypothetical protein